MKGKTKTYGRTYISKKSPLTQGYSETGTDDENLREEIKEKFASEQGEDIHKFHKGFDGKFSYLFKWQYSGEVKSDVKSPEYQFRIEIIKSGDKKDLESSKLCDLEKFLLKNEFKEINLSK